MNNNWDLLNPFFMDKLFTILRKWEEIVDNPIDENQLHKYIEHNAGLFFFSTSYNPVLLTLTRPYFGNEYIPDFINFYDFKSQGTVIEIIEIESSGSQPITKSGLPSQRLNQAIKQITDWKYWLLNNRKLFQEHFPVYCSTHSKMITFRFVIYIGRREQDQKLNLARNLIASNQEISILSFDNLTDKLKSNIFDIPYQGLDYSAQMNALSKEERNQLANPFFVASKYSKIKDYLGRNSTSYHFYGMNAKNIILQREYNELLKEFEERQRKIVELKIDKSMKLINPYYHFQPSNLVDHKEEIFAAIDEFPNWLDYVENNLKMK